MGTFGGIDHPKKQRIRKVGGRFCLEEIRYIPIADEVNDINEALVEVLREPLFWRKAMDGRRMWFHGTERITQKEYKRRLALLHSVTKV